MADWLKTNHTLPRSAKLRKLQKILGVSLNTALGLAMRWLIWIDEQTVDGNTELAQEDVDDMLEHPGVTHGLIAIGWAEADEDGIIHAVDFGKHCGETAKKRALSSRRASSFRRRKNENVTPERYERNAGALRENGQENEFYENLAESDNSVTLERYERNAKSAPEKNRIEYNIKDILKVPNNNTVVKSSDAPTPARTCKPTPSSDAEVRAFMANQALCGLRGEELDACAAGFFDDMEACGWTSRNGAPLFDWQAAARKYLRSWQTRSASAAIASRNAAQPTVYRSETTPDYSL